MKWYSSRYGVQLDRETETIAVIGAKEGISHLALAIVEPGDMALVPNPTYPIHMYSMIIAGANVRSVPLFSGRDFFAAVLDAYHETWPRPKYLVLSFPHNPTGETVNLDFFEKVVDFAKQRDLIVIHDFAYADLCFDGYEAPSFMQVKGAKEVGVEFFSMSKSYNMPGWRVGFCVGNKRIINALARIKSYLDYGIFQPVQIAGDHRNERSSAMCCGHGGNIQVTPGCLGGWLKPDRLQCEKPRGTMFVWAKIPPKYRELGSLEFCKLALRESKVAISPGIGFGDHGEGYVRFALVENQKRTRQALRGLRRILPGT